MYTTSEDFKTIIDNPSRKFECKVICGSKTYTNVNIVNINITGSLQPSGYTIGSAISQKATFKFINDGNVTFPSNIIQLQIGLLVNGSYEYIPMGVYRIDSHDSDDYTITITAYDNMMLLEKKYSGTGTTLTAIAEEICTSCGITLGSTIPTTTVTQLEKDKYTCREVIGYVAGCMCGNAVIDRTGQLKIQNLNLSSIDKQVTTDNWFTYKNADMIFSIEKLICDTGNGKIESGSSTDEAKQLTIKNALMTQSMLDSVKTELSNITFTGFDVKYQGDISTDLGDTVKITDRKGQTLTAPLLQKTINYNGGLTDNIKTEGKKKVDVASSYYANGRYSLDFDKYNYKFGEYDNNFSNINIKFNGIDLQINSLDNRVAKLEKGSGGATLDESIYIIDTTLLDSTDKTFALKSKYGTTIITDWGDGTTNNSLTHTYAQEGTYTIKTNSPYTPNTSSTYGNVWRACLIEIVKLNEVIENCTSSFYNFKNLKKVGDILGVTIANSMFKQCTSLVYPANLGEKIKDCRDMYAGCTSLLDTGSYRESMEQTDFMFDGCSKLQYTGYMSDSITSAERMFRDCVQLVRIDYLSNKLENAEGMFKGCTGLVAKGKNIVLPDSIKNASNMFCDCSSLNANIYWPSSLENASDMFYNCTNMENFRDLINLTNLTNMEGMFRNCTSATFSNVTKCPINVTNLKAAFYGCTMLQLPTEFFSNLVATAINASWCFQNCSNLSNRIDIPTNITKVYFMFAYSGALETTRTVSNEIDYDSMYPYCTNLTTISDAMYELMQDTTYIHGLNCFAGCINIVNPDTYANLSSIGSVCSSWF